MKPAAIAQQTGVSYHSIYVLTRAAGRGFESETEYKRYLARRRGLETDAEYRQYLAQLSARRSTRTEYRVVGQLVRDSLEQLGKNQSWLAAELGVTRQMVSLYAHGKSVPKDKRLAKLLDIAGASQGVRRSLTALLD